MKKLSSIILLFLVAILVAGCGAEDAAPQKVEKTNASSSGETNTSEEANEEEEAAEIEEEAPTKEVFSVGESIQLGDNVLTVDKVDKSAGSDFDKPKEGHEYLILTVTINNAGKENISYNQFDFKMLNSDGQIQDTAFSIIDTDTSLGSGELAPGGKVSGTIVFEQPKDDPGLQLQYTPGFWSDKTIKVDLQ